ncbi:MAG: hypothetical protein ACJAUC_005095, partial [Planctomycetota bacterium]
CRFAGDTVVLKNLPASGDYMGHPVMPKRKYLRLMRELRKIAGV